MGNEVDGRTEPEAAAEVDNSDPFITERAISECVFSKEMFEFACGWFGGSYSALSPYYSIRNRFFLFTSLCSHASVVVRGLAGMTGTPPVHTQRANRPVG